jgi:hypothetical protein
MDDHNEQPLFNPDPYPRYGDKATLVAWHAKDHELRWAARTATPGVPALPTPEAIASVGLDYLPGTDDEKQSWLQRRAMELIRAGATADSPELLKTQLKYSQITETLRTNEVLELMEENRELKQKLNRLERKGIDILADQIQEATEVLVAEEVARQVAALEGRITKAAVEVSPAVSEIEKAHATLTLLRGRIGSLEQLNPLWVQIHTQG